ncbi:haloacid dehalogenase type II [Hymenobacter ginsengisoli]|uniref:Haloacid dehalogenase type II n=1 Tax=Hymenobacter ginsengisoli TaxID=1051626 RepID=A0ABP8PYV7_9BACT|nr:MULTISPECIES: haloacid dehalogenase type II [unclassified Hymenobacter]MBO2030659.1 haloacid dehalogenase type II [Hymenobacter sp. BT559]
MSASLPFARPKAIFFDVNETLLDMSPLKVAVNAAFKSPAAFNQWFGLVLQHSLVATVTDEYFNFGTLADAALDMTANMLEKPPLTHAEKHDLTALLTQLPAHPDVPAGLERLRAAGYRLLALTNSPPTTLAAQLAHAGLTEYFEQALSVDAVQRYKPHPDTYHYAAKQAGVLPAEALLVAAHGWDVAGALHAGLLAGFIARPGQTLYPLAPPPTSQAPTLLELATQLGA